MSDSPKTKPDPPTVDAHTKTTPVDTSDDTKNRGWPKGKKRYPKMPGGPKQPLSGYVHFLNDHRDAVRKEHPELSFADISKKLAEEWSKVLGIMLLRIIYCHRSVFMAYFRVHLHVTTGVSAVKMKETLDAKCGFSISQMAKNALLRPSVW